MGEGWREFRHREGLPRASDAVVGDSSVTGAPARYHRGYAGGNGKVAKSGRKGQYGPTARNSGAGRGQRLDAESTGFPQGGREKWRNSDGRGTPAVRRAPVAIEAASGRDIGNTVAWKGGRGFRRGFYRSCAGRASVRNLQRGTI